MHNKLVREYFLKIISIHRQNAASSEYDRGVCIAAIAVAAQTVEQIPLMNDLDDYRTKVLTALEDLQNNYNDTDGQYTNGKGVIGSLMSDLRYLELDRVS